MKRTIVIFLLYSMLLCCIGLSAQDIRSRSDKRQYNIGDVIELKFRVPFVQGEDQKLINEFPNTDSLELQATLTDTLKEAGKTFLQYSRRYMSFIPGVRNVGDSLYVRCDIAEAAKRVAKAGRSDERYSDEKEAADKLLLRREREKKRYADFYGVDITDMNNYDLVVDTTDKSVEEVAEAIIDGYKEKRGL